MNNWIKTNTTLKGELVELIPMEEEHFEELEILARDKKIWKFIPIDMSTTDNIVNAFSTAIIEKKAGTQFPFVIYHKLDKKVIGSTRFMEIQAVHKKLEIGWTWLHPDYWATATNLECKLLLLAFSFEKLHTIRVQLKTYENNLRSRKAIEKIGGQYEGVLRHDMFRENGTKRNSAYYSILDIEWDNVKKRLIQLYEKRKMKL